MSPETFAAVSTWGPIILMVVIFYLLLYRPQKKEQTRRKDMLAALKRGDKVVTIGGIYGEITRVKDNSLLMKIADNVEIEVAKASVNNNLSAEAE